MSKKIPLTQGKYTIVDDEDYEWLNQFKWYAVRGRSTFYAQRMLKRKCLRMHREIMNAPLGKEVDHRNRDGLDNQRANLRVCTHQQNIFNHIKQKKATSRHKGVSWNKRERKWIARIGHNKQRMYLGYFNNEDEAARAYNEKVTELFGEFARPNNIN